MLQWKWKNNEQSTNILENIDILLLSQKSQISKINFAEQIDILITRNFNVCILVNAQHSCAHSPYVAISRAPDPWGYGKLLNVKHGKLLEVSLILIGILGGGNSTRLLIGHAPAFMPGFEGLCQVLQPTVHECKKVQFFQQQVGFEYPHYLCPHHSSCIHIRIKVSFIGLCHLPKFGAKSTKQPLRWL